MATVSLQAVYDQARRLLESGDTERAVAVAEHILETYPNNLEAHRILGEAHLSSRQLKQAQDAFLTVLHADPENIPAYVGIGITYERQERADLAIGAFEQALEIKPDMPELRSQLLRLYTDTWGSESAQLRLSRAGLARLYAKGHMLPQAIQEFRSVINDQPDRFDARVALAESLWRNGQEDAAVTVCEDILEERPTTLKANLLLGYILLSQGEPRGQQYWNAASAIEPYQTVARALFEQMPDLPPEQPTLSGWDETGWLSMRAERERAAQEQAAREQVSQLQEQPVAAAQAPAADDLFGGSWLDSIQTPQQPSAAPVVNAAEDDAFLASLLSFGDSNSDQQVSEGEVTPFSFDDFDTPSTTGQTTPLPTVAGMYDRPDEAVAPPPAAAAVEPEMTPFSLADLGLSDDEIAAFDSINTPDTPAAAAVEPEMTPFSLADLGLSDDEIAAFDSINTPDTPAAAAVEPEMTPFSLADLGLSDDEIAAFDNINTPDTPAAAAAEPEMTPFSLADLGLSDDEIASLDSVNEAPIQQLPAAEEPTLTPFSLADLGLSDDEIASLDSASSAEVTRAAPLAADEFEGIEPFSLGDWPGDDEQQSGAAKQEGDAYESLDDLQPFSLDDLDISDTGTQNLDIGSLPSSLQPFSLDDVAEASRQERPRQAPMSVPEEEEPLQEPAGFSWQQPTAKPNTDFVRETDQQEAATSGLSIFERLRQRRNELPEVEEPPLRPVSDDETDMSLFSHDEVPLHDDDQSKRSGTTGMAAAAAAIREQFAAAPAPVTEPPSSDEPEMTPFSFADLGLTPDEIAAMGLDEGAAAAPAPVTEPPSSDEPEMTPFSFADLGLTPDEIAAMGLDEGAAVAPAPVAEPPSSDEPDMTPFSFADLGLTPDEIAAMGLDEGAAAAPAPVAEPPSSDEPEMTPFSFADLGLTPDEIAAMGLDEGAAAAPAPVAEPPSSDEPEMTPFSFADLGLTPDEIAAMGLDEGAAAAPAPVAEPPSSDEPDMTPFSFADLGLTPDEIAAMGLDEGAAAAPAPVAEPPSSDEPEMTPFSFADLGLTPDEVASLDFGEATAASAADNDFLGDSDIQPFSFDDLDLGSDVGFSDVKVNELGLTEEDLAGMDLGALGGGASSADQNGYAVDTGDAVLDRLIVLGQRQGFIDLTDIIAAVQNPEEESERIEEIGLVLHRAGIEIRDGDEVIDMEEEAEGEEFEAYTEEVETFETPQPAANAEPDMTPFSLADLGLSAEEIAALGLDEVAPGANNAEASAPSTAPATETPIVSSSDEPEMTPFSFADLGLTPEEIAMLGLEEAATPAANATPAEPTSTDDLLDEFDFNAAEEQLGQRGPVRTQSPRPREEEPPPPISPEDQAFTPEPLEALDTIWTEIEPPVAKQVEPPAPPATSQPKVEPRASVIERLPARNTPPRETTPSKRAVPERSPVRETPAPPPARETPQRAAQPTTERRAPAWRSSQSPTTFIPTGDAQLDGYLLQLEAEPNNERLRLAVARLGGKTGRFDLAAQQYKVLIKAEGDLADVVDDIQELINDSDEEGQLRRLYRLLGDAYAKQNRYRDAVEAYSWTFGK